MNLIDALQITSIDILEEGYTATMALNEFHAQPLGYLNGGATLAFAEISAGMASNQILERGFFAVGQNISANHLHPKKAEGQLVAKGQLLKKGHRGHLWDIKIYDEEEKLISVVTVENAIITVEK